ncbi:MAG: preprotein translocase subunit SecG [Clostridiales bacterium]|nr:preprotein translocase subunit SecG [Clostridiales bacterium]MCD8157921.1 preprotein translocase subunit SecG [Clostridiales bacterium]
MVFNILCVLILISCIGVNVCILMQNKRAGGFTGNVSGMGGQQTYWDKNKGKSFEKKLERYTIIISIIFVVLALISNLI